MSSSGNPLFTPSLAMDTGSNFVWVCCCFGCPYGFNPDRSITYAKIPSISPKCFSFTLGTFQEGPDCRFSTVYEDGMWSSGVIARDTFTLATSDSGLRKVLDVMFGCTTDTGGRTSALGGVLGMVAQSPYHLAARLSSRFSYCIGDLRDHGYAHN
ncbi:Eukaryotic aspartyl protease family protein [Striga hermonthica]|uniref:Eukaryotic aspartyl protease family protein n=1 Tax=Striga hermonthica TaxID=68872 RepID=A0A9N7MJJ1_STRHE|nr:Eukaryotic aspartyl protease family protein [Striga hermonthica]